MYNANMFVDICTIHLYIKSRYLSLYKFINLFIVGYIILLFSLYHLRVSTFIWSLWLNKLFYLLFKPSQKGGR